MASKYHLKCADKESILALLADENGNVEVPKPCECSREFLLFMKDFYTKYYPEETRQIL